MCIDTSPVIECKGLYEHKYQKLNEEFHIIVFAIFFFTNHINRMITGFLVVIELKIQRKQTWLIPL